MEIEIKNKIRPIYYELQGYLDKAPNKDIFCSLQESVEDEINSSIDELNNIISSDKYERFKIRSTPWNDDIKIDIVFYKNQLIGLINRIYGEYFSEENPPLSSMPSQAINFINHQSQNQNQTMILEFEQQIDKMIANAKNNNEKDYFERIKDGLPSVKNIIELMSLILSTAANLGIPISSLAQFFK